jgi:glycosyltransferase involved in cell wall biosynthesis
MYNQAKVGLALSACEGAMLASVEYMLCGLPQVSTPCRGGRELFFDAQYVAVVEATPEAVAAGVSEMIARKIDPQFVREMTLYKIHAHRTKLCNYVRNLIRQAGGSVPSQEQLYAHLFDDAQGVTRRFVHFRNYAACGLV